jgi:acetyl esterase/lipase
MRIPSLPVRWMLLLATLLLAGRMAAAEPLTMPLWPGEPPLPAGSTPAPEGQEKDLSKPNDGRIAGRTVIRLGNVRTPTLTVHRPPADRDTGAAVLICPGGGYRILALDLEGTEVCEWLNSIGVTGVVLKYRVPRANGEADRHPPALQDSQRAMGLIRQHAKEWGIDAKRVGVLGFSAGGHLAAATSTQFEGRSYARVDAADDLPSRPDFTVLVYPGYLADKATGALFPDLAIPASTPPAFVVMTQDDPVRVENAYAYAQGLLKAKVPCELHVYPRGGHGYGLRPTELPVTHWPERAAEWLRERGLLEKR